MRYLRKHVLIHFFNGYRWIANAVFAGFLLHSVSGTCQLFPKENWKEDLELSIVGDPQHFVPSAIYTVELKSGETFSRFFLTSEGESREGTFQAVNDGLATLSEDCINTLTERDLKRKAKVTFLWAPPAFGCVNLKGAVAIKGVFYTTNKTICSIDEIPTKEEKCCSCDHAKYKLVFEGLWSPTTHPKDYPSLLWMLHFSDVIGASHSSDFTLWQEGKLSSYGVQQMAEYGIARELETEIRNQSIKIKTIINAAGLWHPDVNKKTTTLFKVDPRRHLLSMASMFGPSPDWFVGVSRMELCLPNCTWLHQSVLDLYPYDAGTDSGISYMSPNIPTDPPERIQKITAMYPEDARSPFYDPVEEKMEPFARLYITRENVFSKKCSDMTEDEILEQVSRTENTEDQASSFHGAAECSVSDYSDWSACSVSCGKGIRQRSRKYLNQDKAAMMNCDRQLVSREMCAALEPKCPGESEEEIEPVEIGSMCDVTTWTDWSDCTVTCGIGIKFRSRSLTPSANSTLKKCGHISLMEKQKCMEPPCHSQEPKIPRVCSTSEWSDWSPCSVTCGVGLRKSHRYFLSKVTPSHCNNYVNLTQTLKCVNADKCNVDPSLVHSVCTAEPDAGPCRGTFPRWAYNINEETCKKFTYGGCRGNRNNFNSFSHCNETCGAATKENENIVEGGGGKAVDCIVSKWSQWSPCYPCINGTKTKTRKILVPARNEGKACSTLERSVTCNLPLEFCQDNNRYKK